MMSKRFKEITSEKGDSYIINADYVIGLRRNSDDKGGVLIVSQLSTDGNRGLIKLSEIAVYDVEEWLKGQ